MLRLTKRSERPLEVFDHGPANEAGGAQGLLEYFGQFLLKFNMRSNQIKKRNAGRSAHLTSIVGSILRNILAGLPATIVLGGTSFVTTLPAPTRAFSPMVILARMVLPEPIEAPFFTRVGSTFQSASVCRPPSSVVALG